jgi:ABC-type phosphate transport system substrate-binding protein
MRGMRVAILVLTLPCWFTVARPYARSGAVRAQAPVATAPSYRIIVHPQNPVSSAGRRFVAEAFLKKTTRWQDGEVIRPVDLPLESAARRKFTDEVLGRSVAAVRSYWQQLIFAGRDVPPPELDGDAAVVAYVLRNRGGLGYVSGSASLAGAKAIAVK